MKKKKLIVGITVPQSIGLLKGQLNYFSAHGYDACLLTQHDERSSNYCKEEGCRKLNVKIERNISIKKDWKTLIALIKIFRQEKPDVVNVGTPKMGLLGMIAAWLCRVPNRIYTCRGFRYEHEHGKLRKILMACEWIAGACAHQIICISPSVKALGVKDGLFEEKKCVVINKGSSNGIDPEQFSPSKVSQHDTDALKDKYGLKGKFVYGFLGRVVDRKGINELFEAFCSIYDEDQNVRLFVVGPWEMEQVKDKNLMTKMQDHPGVVVTGKTFDVALHFSVMDVFVLPAWWEGFGNVVVQAADMGLAVIGSTGTGVCDAVSDGFNGLHVPIRNVAKLTEAMKLIKADQVLREKLAANGPIWGQNFKPEIIWDGMDKLYKAR